MAQIISFPGASEREWRGIEEDLRRTYADWPDGPSTIDEALPTIRAHWDRTNESFEVPLTYSIPGPVTAEQVEAIKSAVTQGMNAVSERLRSQRANLFAALVAAEFKAAYYRRNGGEV